MDVSFDKYFRASSYAMVGSGALVLALAGGLGAWLGAAFAAVLVLTWRLEGTRWQLSERVGMIVVLAALPVFYLDWKYQSAASTSATGIHTGLGALVHFTLTLTTVKLLQVKADRDWLFLYLISFFQVLLAASLSLSPMFLLGLGVYVFCALLASVCFELRKSSRVAPASESRLLVANDPKLLWRKGGENRGARVLRRLPLAAVSLFLLILAFALPIFFVMPRSAEGAWAMRAGAGATGYVGFSDRVTLGDIGRLQESDQLVMRVRVEGPGVKAPGGQLRWRGVALDRFDGRRWSLSSNHFETKLPNARNLFRLGTTEDLNRLTAQTFFVEPIDTPVLFAAPRAVAVQGALNYVRLDDEGSISSRPHAQERITYRVYSDTFEPSPEELRADRMPDPLGATPNLRRPVEDYLQLPPSLDTRIGSLAWTVVNEARAGNTYDAARALEAHLGSNEYGGRYTYSLDMRAAGPDPLADFLFNVRAGHCEYYATAMVVMLRTLRIPARIVNGFQSGEYNGAADAYIVRQSDAHSWVEVYFSETDSWVTFDPTPVAGRPGGARADGLMGSLRQYADALELMWLQYVVAYDRQGQRTLARTMRDRLGSFVASAVEMGDAARERVSSFWSESVAGGGDGWRGLFASPLLPVSGLLFLGLAGAYFLRRSGRFLGMGRAKRARGGTEPVVVEFYERMTRALEARGLRRRDDETPLEFAAATGSADALKVTGAYNRVRFGGRKLSDAEVAEVEDCLRKVESEAAVHSAPR